MKSLISIFTYCPDSQTKIFLTELLVKLQPIRSQFEIMVVSHSEIPSLVKDLTDYIYIESENDLLYDFESLNKFWFKSENLHLRSCLNYPFSTHLSIYSLIHYTLNFCKFKNYQKVHLIEYDINLNNLETIFFVDQKLEEKDNVMFVSEDNWTHGVYIGTKTNNLPEKYFQYDREFIIEEIQKEETRMSEYYTPKFFSVNNRTTHFESIKKISPDGIIQKKDSHGNDNLNWCVPVVEKNTDFLYFFVFNEKGGTHQITVVTNLDTITFDAGQKEFWKLIPMGPFSNIKEIKIIVDDKIQHNISFDDKNRIAFTQNNYFYYQ